MSMQRNIEGKLALVTGGARRVGRGVALGLAQAGMDVAITFKRSADEARELTAAIESMGRRSFALEVDMTQAGAADYIVAEMSRRFDRLDALVNNASTFHATPLGSISAEQYDRDMSVNARTPLLLIQGFADRLAAHFSPEDPSSSGRVVNFIDIHVLGEPLKSFVSYNASKAALMEITASCALELAPAVTVNAIAPGVVAWTESYGQKMRTEYMKRVPLARAGTPEDAAAATLFLIADAHYCTGQVLRLDGGRLLT